MNEWSDFAGAIGAIIAAVIAGIALLVSVRTYKSTTSLSHYAELDQMYADLLRLAVEIPHLRLSPAPQRTADEQAQFDAYAYMIWNFIETVYDRIYDDSDADKKLRKTWCMVIREEKRLFGEWFNNHHDKFKSKLKSFIDNETNYPIDG